MKTIGRTQRHCWIKTIDRQDGFILVAALTLLTTLILVGVTTYLVSSTNARIAGNYKLSQAVLQVAMAGTEQARENLRSANASSANTSSFTEELVARVGANGVLNGYTTTTDDVPMATGTMTVGGKTYTYNAYLTNDSTEGVSTTTDLNGRAVITSVATGPNNAKAIVTTTVQLYTFSTSSPAALYSKDNVTLSGSSLSINGTNAGAATCGGANLSAVYNYDPSTTSTNGNPATTGGIAHGSTNIDLAALVNSLKGGATTNLSASPPNNTTYGSSTNDVIVYANTSISTNGLNGYGILLVEGDLSLAGNLDWNGIIIVTGVLSSSGGGKVGKNITGQIYTGSSALGDTTISGNIDIAYDSCAVKKALAGQPLTVVNWKQS